MMKRSYQNIAAYTLIEMAIVLVVVGLLISVVMTGVYLVSQSKVRTIIAEQETYQAAIKNFLDRYNELPGDMSDASGYWGSASDGDGDEQIEWSADEGVQAWYQLQESKMITRGGLTGTATSAKAVIDTNVPSSAIRGSVGWYLDYDSTVGNHLGLGAQETTGVNDGPALSASEAKKIDEKLDDGIANSGRVFSNGTNCHSSGTYSVGAASSEGVDCDMQIRLVTE
ncbi:MAG: type II secretion system protein [Rickettsiales bacterium]|nr:type II secretion system protein [Rickettsiales bacterium]